MHRFIAILFVTAGFLPAAVEPARTAMSVVDSLGVNTHLGYGDTVYGSAYEQVVKPKLLALGVRHIRDSAQNGAVGQKYRELFEAGEIRVLEICDPRLDWMANPTTETMRQIANACGPALEAMEGPNEYDGGKDWITVLRSFCTRLYQAAKAEPLTAKFPVLAPSLIQPGNYSQLGDCSEFVDGSNLHHYMGGHHPGTGGWGDDHYGSLEWILRTCAKRQAPTKPVYVTECGFHSAIKQSQGGHNPTSELASGAYTIRQWLGNVQAGIVRSYLYEFIEGSGDPDLVNAEAHFGLLRHDGTEKPSYRVLREVLNELRDPGPTFTPGKFNCEITGQDNDTRHLVIQKRDGTAYVLLWREVESWDANHRLDLPIAPLPVSLSLVASAVEATVVTFDAQGAANRRKVNCTNGQVRLVLTEQVTLVRFDGRQARVVGKPPMTPR